MDGIESNPVSVVSIKFEGKLTIQTVGDVHRAWMPILMNEGIAIDLSGVEAVDVAGLQLLLAMRAYAQREGRVCVFTGLTPSLYQVICLLSLNSQLLDE